MKTQQNFAKCFIYDIQKLEKKKYKDEKCC